MPPHMQPKLPYVRRHYLIARRFQLRFAFQVLLLLVFTSLVIGWTVYYSAWHTSEKQLETLVSKNTLSRSDVVQFREQLQVALGEKVFLRFLLLIFIAFVFTVFSTHRIAGPIRNMEKVLREHLRGDTRRIVKLRKTDEFQDFANLLNEVLESKQHTVPESASREPPSRAESS